MIYSYRWRRLRWTNTSMRMVTYTRPTWQSCWTRWCRRPASTNNDHWTIIFIIILWIISFFVCRSWHPLVGTWSGCSPHRTESPLLCIIKKIPSSTLLIWSQDSLGSWYDTEWSPDWDVRSWRPGAGLMRTFLFWNSDSYICSFWLLIWSSIRDVYSYKN